MKQKLTVIIFYANNYKSMTPSRFLDIHKGNRTSSTKDVHMSFVYLLSKFHTGYFIELLVKFGVTWFLDFQNLLGPCLRMNKAVMLTQLGVVIFLLFAL